ncbi:zygote arrest protein 1.L-like [Physella acuta]|uniref:zygote arrest protein 1.L-like n=1 Tax=Physella acuta TaxID=109671 RepID=UPI0027DC8CDB|nr:zygote arrest protein 1.L-like [Physella acuta]
MSSDDCERMFGHFRCSKCENTWSSAHVYCIKTNAGESQAQYGQKCRNCQTMNKPYRVQNLECPSCFHRPCRCYDDSDDDSCSDDDDDRSRSDLDRWSSSDDDEGPVELKPHRSDLCERCLKGKKCTGN